MLRAGWSVIVLAFWAAATTLAQAQLLVSPLRVVLSEGERRAELTVSNQSERMLDLKLSWIELTALPDGDYRPRATHPPEQTADLEAAAASPFVAVQPRRALLPPGESLDVAIAQSRAAPAGERRSHLLIEASAPAETVRRIGLADVPLDMTLGVSIPVLVRAGPARARAHIAEAAFRRAPDGALILDVRLTGEGGFSAYGALRALWRPSRGAARETLGELANLAIYPDAAERRVSMNLTRSALQGGIMDLIFEGADEYAGEVFDRRQFTIEPTPPAQ